MTTYIYTAKKDTAETVTGTINAQNEEEAINLINQLGFLPVSIEEKAEDEQKRKWIQPKKVSSKELYNFSRQLANLLKAGVPLLRGLNILSEQTQSYYFKRIVADMSSGSPRQAGYRYRQGIGCVAPRRLVSRRSRRGTLPVGRSASVG